MQRSCVWYVASPSGARGSNWPGNSGGPGGRLPSHPPFRRAEMEGRRSRGGAIGKGDGRSLESMAQRFRRAEMIPDATCFPARSSLPEIINPGRFRRAEIGTSENAARAAGQWGKKLSPSPALWINRA